MTINQKLLAEIDAEFNKEPTKTIGTQNNDVLASCLTRYSTSDLLDTLHYIHKSDLDYTSFKEPNPETKLLDDFAIIPK